MIIRLKDIEERSKHYEFRIAQADFINPEPRFSFDWMTCKAELSIINESVLLFGNYSVKLEANCDFCLVPVKLELSESFELHLIPEEDRAETQGDFEISLESADVDFYGGQEINLNQYFEEQYLLDLPFSIKCSEECLGLCSGCGVNRNLEECKCEKDIRSNPFSVLKDLKT